MKTFSILRNKAIAKKDGSTVDRLICQCKETGNTVLLSLGGFNSPDDQITFLKENGLRCITFAEAKHVREDNGEEYTTKYAFIDRLVVDAVTTGLQC